MPQDFKNPVVFVLVALIVVYLLYVLYKVAEHVHAWPFS